MSEAAATVIDRLARLEARRESDHDAIRKLTAIVIGNGARGLSEELRDTQQHLEITDGKLDALIQRLDEKTRDVQATHLRRVERAVAWVLGVSVALVNIVPALLTWWSG